MSPTEENSSPQENQADIVKGTDIYKGIEAMVSLQVTELSELIQKLKSAKTTTARKLYQNKIDKKRAKILKYMFQLDNLTKGKVQEVLEEIGVENSVEDDSEISADILVGDTD